VGFVVDKDALGRVFSEYFGFPCNLHSTKFSIIIITRSKYNRPISGCRAEWTQLDSPPTKQIKNFLDKWQTQQMALTTAGAVIEMVAQRMDTQNKHRQV
jgi:hypothetical protein